MKANITTKYLQSLRPKKIPYFIRSTSGFGIKINPKGTIKYIIEARHEGRTIRKTIGSYPTMPLKLAKEEGARLLQEIYTEPQRRRSATTLEELFSSYTSTLSLKQSTLKDYQTVIPHYLSDWMSLVNLSNSFI